MALASRSERPETSPQQRGRGGVELDADAVDARPRPTVSSSPLQRLLVDVVLVLADAERARARSSPARRAGPGGGGRSRPRRAGRRRASAAPRAPPPRRSRPRRRSRGRSPPPTLSSPRLLHRLAGEGLGLAAGGAVADRHGVDAVLLDQRADGPRRAASSTVRLDGMDDVRRHDRPVPSTTASLQPVRKPGSRPITGTCAERRLEEQRFQVGAEDGDRLRLGALAHLAAHLVGDRRARAGACSRPPWPRRSAGRRRVSSGRRQERPRRSTSRSSSTRRSEIRKPSRSPRRMASRRWEGMSRPGSSCSK